MKRLLSISLGALGLAAVTLAALPAGAPALPAALQGTVCVQDQYGNQYAFVVDETHQYVYGTMLCGQSCATPIWPLTGSYVRVGGELLLELTVSNPQGACTFCVTTYKLKGVYPDFAWYYETGYGAQESTFVACGADASANPEEGGILGP